MGRCVLIVEDHADSGESYALLLRKCGYTAQLMATAEEAFESLETTRPDLILLDYHLGGGTDGVQVLGRLAERPEWRSIPVVMMSASMQPQPVVSEAMRLGARAWVEKTNTQIGDLLGIIGRVCSAGDPADDPRVSRIP